MSQLQGMTSLFLSHAYTHTYTQLIPPTDAQISKASLCRIKTDSLHAHVYLNLSALKLIWILGLFKNVYTLLLLRNEYISCHTCLQAEFAVREFCVLPPTLAVG